MTNRDTLVGVAERAISVRLDEAADAALARLMVDGMTRSEAIRVALVESAGRRSGDRSLAAEAARLAASEADRREVAAVRELMDGLRASW